MEIINNGSKGNGRLYNSIHHITRITISTNDEPEKYLGAAGSSFEERYSNVLRDFKHKEHGFFKIYFEFEELAANYVRWKSFLRLPETHKALQLLVFFLFFHFYPCDTRCLQCVDVNNSLQTVFKRVSTIYT